MWFFRSSITRLMYGSGNCAGADSIAVEPQVLDLLVYLIENRDRVVTKDDLIASVWRGRIVSESTLTSRINAARKAVGDSGNEQRLIRTVPRKGFRFVGEVSESPATSRTVGVADVSAPRAQPQDGPIRSEGGRREEPDALSRIEPRRASIAVMPFVDLSAATDVKRGGTADALAFDIITRLAKLRSLFVIAQGTVFALQERGVGPGEVGNFLDVDYVVSGSLRRFDQRLAVSVELMEVRTARIVWVEEFDRPLDDAFLVLDQIGDSIVGSIVSEVETIERNRAVLKPPESLDAWEAFHRGLWHMYRFNQADNAQARHFFDLATRLDPTFSRAYAGLSFTHWQNAFQGWTDRKAEIELAYAAAGQSLMADDRDPGAHWAMGRALWLKGQLDGSLTQLNQAVDLSPNFAQGHYSLAFVHATTGDPALAVPSADQSRRLSPFDPMLFATLAARATALARLGRFDEAAEWAASGAARPNAHAHILALAAYTRALAGQPAAGRAYLAKIRQSFPNYGIENFLTAMHLGPEGTVLFREAAKRIDAD
jgi:TolB-like protein/DNA-binding winged helix-turn-helix (wHTH) protein/Tfp pilus assembly protein PilF